MALMKRLFSLNETRELMDYFGELIAYDAVIELTKRTQNSPDTHHFIVSRRSELAVVDLCEYLPYLSDGWSVEMDSELLLKEGICSPPTTAKKSEQ